jgi:hypothetical protein
MTITTILRTGLMAISVSSFLQGVVSPEKAEIPEKDEIERKADLCRCFKMPSKKRIQELLDDPYYDEKTNISGILANKYLIPAGVYNQVLISNYDFSKYLGVDPATNFTTHMLTDIRVEKLLQDNPDAIECLKQMGVLRSSKKRAKQK